MRKITLLFVVFITIASYSLTAQVAINTDDSQPDGSAMLDVKSTEKGMLIPRMTQTEIETITSPANGLTVFCTTDDKFYAFILASNVWKEIQYGEGTITPYIPPSTLPTGSGSFAGKMCFDIAESNDDLNDCGTLASRTPLRADFNQSNTYSQSYTFTPDGTVSNVRFYYINTNGDVITAISGDDTGNNISTPVVASVTYNQDLSSDDPNSPGNGLACGLTFSNPLTAIIYAVYNDAADGTGTDRQLNLTASVKDCNCCGLYVASGVWKEFMCHNLGANYSLDPFTPNWDINGAYWQWGRLGPADHRDTNNTSYFAARPTNATAGGANSGFITGWDRNYPANNAWQDAIKTATDPCPTGYRVPTNTQWAGAVANNTWNLVGTWTSSTTNYTSGIEVLETLFMPAAGFRNYYFGVLGTRGFYGYYCSSTYHSTGNAWFLGFGSSLISTSPDYLTTGYSVRCIAE
jgi:uncharacterized protein (TIGR02145 family)